MHYVTTLELSSHEGTRCQFNGGRCAIKLGIDVHQDFYVVVEQEAGAIPKPPSVPKASVSALGEQTKSRGAEVYAVYEGAGLVFVCSGN